MPVHCSSGAAPSMPRPTAVYNRGMAARESRRYHRLQLLLGLTRLALGAAYLVAVLLAGGGQALAALAAGVTASAAGQVALVAAALGAGHTLLGLPTAWLSSWVLPRRYGLLHQPLRAWLADRAKAAALGAAIGLAGVEVLYALLRVTPLWWLAAAALAFAFAIALTAAIRMTLEATKGVPISRVPATRRPLKEPMTRPAPRPRPSDRCPATPATSTMTVARAADATTVSRTTPPTFTE